MAGKKYMDEKTWLGIPNRRLIMSNDLWYQY
jgi:hypothetical protein